MITGRTLSEEVSSWTPVLICFFSVWEKGALLQWPKSFRTVFQSEELQILQEAVIYQTKYPKEVLFFPLLKKCATTKKAMQKPPQPSIMNRTASAEKYWFSNTGTNISFSSLRQSPFLKKRWTRFTPLIICVHGTRRMIRTVVFLHLKK